MGRVESVSNDILLSQLHTFSTMSLSSIAVATADHHKDDILEHALTERRGYKETGPKAAETGLHVCKSANTADTNGKCDLCGVG